MSARFIARIVFALALVFALSAPLSTPVAACDVDITGFC